MRLNEMDKIDLQRINLFERMVKKGGRRKKNEKPFFTHFSHSTAAHFNTCEL